MSTDSNSGRQLTYFLFAGRRIVYMGQKSLILISPKTGRHFFVEEKILKNSYVSLGDFLFAKRTTRRVLYDFEKCTPPKKFSVRVEGDLAYIEDLQCKLEEENGIKLFRCRSFGDIICKEQLDLGEYIVRVHLLPQTVVTKERKVIHFEGIHLKSLAENQESHSTPIAVSPEIETQPSSKLVFNAPFDRTNTCHMKLINSFDYRIGVGIKTSNKKRFKIDPKFSVLDPNESVLVAVTCDSFSLDEEKEETKDKIIIGWIIAPDGSEKQFRREWFNGDILIRGKHLAIEYNF